MLKNGGFEKEWAGSHRVLVVEPSGIREKDIGNIFVPPDWMVWFVHESGIWDQPEAGEIHAEHYPERVRSGAKAFRLFTYHRRHHAGLLQKVSVEPGTKLRLTAWAHAWSNHPIQGHEGCTDDGRCSAGVGRGGHCLTEAPPLNGNPWNDAIGNFTFAVAIDTKGGVDPKADSVVVGAPKHIYNEFCQLEVEAVAEASEVTVFLGSQTLWAFKHNDSYWDDVELVEVEKPPEPTYKSTMLVLPQDATRERLGEILDEGYPQRRTFGFSHDDAGKLGHPVLYDIPESEQQDYLAWYAEKWPSAQVEFADNSEDPWAKYRPFLLWQADPEWADHVYAGGQCYRLAEQGCFITINASAQRWYGIDPDATPVTVDLAVGPEGYDRCLLLHNAMRSKLGLDIKSTTDEDVAIDWVNGGDVVFIEVEPASMMHFVMAVGYDTDFVVLDPLKNKIGYLKDLYAGAESFRLILKYEETNGEPQYPAPKQMLCFQQQRAGDYRDQFITAVKPDYWKLIGAMGEAHHLLSLHPEMKIVYRHHHDNWGEFVLADDKDQAAQRFVAMFRDSLERHADVIYGIEGLNEWIATNDYDTLKHASGWVEAFCAELDRIGMPAVPITFNTAVGNPQTDAICEREGIPSQIAYLVDGVQATIAAGGEVGYHAYHGARTTSSVRTALRSMSKWYSLATLRRMRSRTGWPKWYWYKTKHLASSIASALKAKLAGEHYYCTLDGDEARYYSMRALLEWDPHFRAKGLYPKYLFTEGGTIYIAPWGGMPSAYAGWQDKDCFGGDMDWRMEQAVKRHIQSCGLFAKWNREHGNRARTMLTFGLGMTSEWVDFEWEGEPGRQLA